MTVLLPPLYYPFHSRINPHAEEADQEVIRWVGSLGLAPSPQWPEYYQKARFTWFAARSFPRANYQRL